MSRYDALTEALRAREDERVVLTFDELDAIVGGLPNSARTYGAWWANKRSSQPHARAWLDAGRRATPDFHAGQATFVFDEAAMDGEGPGPVEVEEGRQAVAEYVESSIGLERDLEDHLIHHLETVEPGLSLVGRQVVAEVGRIDILAKDAAGQKVIIELKVGEARDASIGQVARYMGWFARQDSKTPRAILIAGAFSESVSYAAAAIPGLRLLSYRVSFQFEDVAAG